MECSLSLFPIKEIDHDTRAGLNQLPACRPIKDVSTTYWVICKKTRANVLFFKKLKKTLERRFMQEEITMYYIPVYRF